MYACVYVCMYGCMYAHMQMHALVCALIHVLMCTHQPPNYPLYFYSYSCHLLRTEPQAPHILCTASWPLLVTTTIRKMFEQHRNWDQIYTKQGQRWWHGLSLKWPPKSPCAKKALTTMQQCLGMWPLRGDWIIRVLTESVHQSISGFWPYWVIWEVQETWLKELDHWGSDLEGYKLPRPFLTLLFLFAPWP